MTIASPVQNVPRGKPRKSETTRQIWIDDGSTVGVNAGELCWHENELVQVANSRSQAGKTALTIDQAAITGSTYTLDCLHGAQLDFKITGALGQAVDFTFANLPDGEEAVVEFAAAQTTGPTFNSTDKRTPDPAWTAPVTVRCRAIDGEQKLWAWQDVNW